MSAEEALELAARSAPVCAREALQSRPPRHSLIRRASMLWRGGTFSVRLRNISADGAMIESPEEIEKGSHIELDLSAGVRLEGEVCWAQDGRIGLKFSEAFNLQLLGQAKSGSRVLRPDYLKSETSPDSPWAGRHDRFTIKDVRSK